MGLKWVKWAVRVDKWALVWSLLKKIGEEMKNKFQRDIMTLKKSNNYISCDSNRTKTENENDTDDHHYVTIKWGNCGEFSAVKLYCSVM